jgi:GNAT superfamily N-acetyltransferase
MRVEEIDAASCWDLRARVLRDGTPSTDPRFPEDSQPGTFHLGAFDPDGRLMAVVTLAAQPTPLRPASNAAQLRGMATEPAVRGQGYGQALVMVAVERLRSAGVEVVWARARDGALGFYERVGFLVEGEGYVTAETGLRHHTVVLDL